MCRTAQLQRLERAMSGALPNLSISGATGHIAQLVNGIWDRSGEEVSGLPVYFKRDNPDMCLEYHAATNKWFIRPLAHRGTDRGHAYVVCPAGVPVESCSNSWMVAVTGVFVSQPSVKVVKHM